MADGRYLLSGSAAPRALRLRRGEPLVDRGDRGDRVSHFLNVPTLVASTDLVAALSRRVAELFARMLPLRLFEPPLRLRASRIGMVWHDSVDHDPGHRWLRTMVAEVCARV